MVYLDCRKDMLVLKTIEIIVPCFNEEDNINPFLEEIYKTLRNEPSDWSIIFVDDGSTDGTLKTIKDCANSNKYHNKIKYISFARNFGKEAAMYAGLQKSTSDYVAVMDVDLQHPPTMLKEMISILENTDYDCVGAQRVSRIGEPIVKSFLSRGFYHVINWVTGLRLIPGMTDFRLMRRKVADAIVSMCERERFTKGIYSWVGFKTKWLVYENVERVHGTSKWSVKSLMSYAGSGFIAFATTPLRGVIYFGMLVVIMSFVYAIKLIRQTLYFDREWKETTTIILLLLFIGGVIITVLGLIGEYIARIYMETKERPIYIVRESNIDG